MKSNRNKYLAFSGGILALISVALFLVTREEGKGEIDRNLFSVMDTERIDRVRLESPRDTVELTYDGTRWRVNGRWEADVQVIKVLMATLRQAEPRRPVAASKRDTVRRQLEKSGTRVVLEEAGEEKMAFVAGGNAQKTEAWFLKANDTMPYVMIIPGYRVYVSGILQMEKGNWRNKRIFEFNWRNFKSLAAVYPNEPQQNFSVEMKQRYFGITGIQQVDTTKLNDYLDAVSLLIAKRFVSQGDEVAERAIAKGTLVHLEIKDIGGRTYSLELFAPVEADTEVYGRMTGGELVAFDRDAISSIALRRTYFVAKHDH